MYLSHCMRVIAAQLNAGVTSMRLQRVLYWRAFCQKCPGTQFQKCRVKRRGCRNGAAGGQLRQARFDFGRSETENNQWPNGFAN